MDSSSFDRLAVLASRMKERGSRRAILGLLLGGGAIALESAPTGAKNKNKRCKGYGAACNGNKDCCYGRCRYGRCYPDGGGGGGNCNCPNGWRCCRQNGYDYCTPYSCNDGGGCNCQNGWHCCHQNGIGYCTPNGYGACCGGYGWQDGYQCCGGGGCPGNSRCCGSSCCLAGFECCNNGQCCPTGMRCTNSGCLPWQFWDADAETARAAEIPFTPAFSPTEDARVPLVTPAGKD